MKLHADIAHPINSECRKMIQERVVKDFEVEIDRSQQPDYKPVDLDVDDYEVPGA